MGNILISYVLVLNELVKRACPDAKFAALHLTNNLGEKHINLFKSEITYFGFHVSSVTVSHVKCITDAVKVYLAGH